MSKFFQNEYPALWLTLKDAYTIHIHLSLHLKIVKKLKFNELLTLHSCFSKLKKKAHIHHEGFFESTNSRRVEQDKAIINNRMNEIFKLKGEICIFLKV